MTTRKKTQQVQNKLPSPSRQPSADKRRQHLEIKLIEALNSPALNGGFNTLLAKVSKIEETQGTLISKVNDVREAIYRPDDGLFARIRTAETDHEKDIIELQSWRESVNKDLLIDAEDDRELKVKVANHELTIAVLKAHRDRIVSIIKWFFVALGGGGIGLLFQWLSTFIS